MADNFSTASRRSSHAPAEADAARRSSVPAEPAQPAAAPAEARGMTAPSKPDNASRRKIPSERDMAIYKQVKIKGKQQWEVAVDYELHYSRVCQIVKRVRRWLADGGEVNDPGVRDQAARDRLATATYKLRLMRVLELCSIALELKPSNRTTKKRIVGGHEVWREEIETDVPGVNLGALRLMIQTTEALHRLEEKPDAPQKGPPRDDRDLFRAVFDMLCRWRARGEIDGRLPSSGNVYALVSGTLAGLVGEEMAKWRPIEVAEECVIADYAHREAAKKGAAGFEEAEEFEEAGSGVAASAEDSPEDQDEAQPRDTGAQASAAFTQVTAAGAQVGLQPSAPVEPPSAQVALQPSAPVEPPSAQVALNLSASRARPIARTPEADATYDPSPGAATFSLERFAPPRPQGPPADGTGPNPSLWQGTTPAPAG